MILGGLLAGFVGCSFGVDWLIGAGGGLIGRLVGWCVGWLVGCFVDWLVLVSRSWLVG